MTEAEWLCCADPWRMLALLRGRPPRRRPLLLLACACCRLAWDALADPRSRAAVEVAECYADGRAAPADLEGVAARARGPGRPLLA